MSRISAALCLIAALLGGLTLRGLAGNGNDPAPPTAGKEQHPSRRVARKVGVLRSASIAESSGLAPSRLQKGVLWTHNDSGHKARVFALDTRGNHVGTFMLGVKALDLEDIASVRLDGKSYLVLADTGDNGRRRESCVLHIFEEPAIGPGGRARLVRSLRFRFPDGAEDCEAMAVCPKTKTIYLLAKRFLPRTRLYALPWPERSSPKVAVARVVAEPRIAMVTGMDFSPDGSRAVVLTYTAVFEYHRRAGESWAEAFRRRPQWVALPSAGQVEGICYGPEGRRLYISSEGRHSALWEIELAAPRPPEKPPASSRR